MSAVVQLRPDDEPSDARARLLARRDSLAAELARLGRPFGIRAEAATVLAEVKAALASLTREETEGWSAWARDPSSVDEPRAANSAARQDLMRRKALAEADIASAERAGAAVEAARLRLTDELRQVGLDLFRLELDDIVGEYLAANAERNEHLIALAAQTERLDGWRDAVQSASDRALEANRPGAAERVGILKSALGRMAVGRNVAIDCSPQKRARHAAEIARRLA